MDGGTSQRRRRTCSMQQARHSLTQLQWTHMNTQIWGGGGELTLLREQQQASRPSSLSTAAAGGRNAAFYAIWKTRESGWERGKYRQPTPRLLNLSNIQLSAKWKPNFSRVGQLNSQFFWEEPIMLIQDRKLDTPEPQSTITRADEKIQQFPLSCLVSSLRGELQNIVLVLYYCLYLLAGFRKLVSGQQQRRSL